MRAARVFVHTETCISSFIYVSYAHSAAGMAIFGENFTNMKNMSRSLSAASLLLLPLLFFLSCAKKPLSVKSGSISVRFSDGVIYQTKSLPDTNDFLLKIESSDGRLIYSGPFGAAPEVFAALPGAYVVSACSREFDEPLYDAPQYGDCRSVIVGPEQSVTVTLTCTMLNSGMRLVPDADFISEYPGVELYMKSSDGFLMFGSSERRTAYFRPGTVALSMKHGGRERLLFTRELSAREICTVHLSAPQAASGGGIDIQLDTTAVRTEDDCSVTEEGSGNDVSTAYSVEEAKRHVGEDDVWVYGYIAGGDLTSSKCSFKAPFTSRTNLVLAPRSTTSEKSSCLSVQLASGDVRNDLNLVDHPGNLGRQLLVKGQIVASYYGIPGVQNISEYRWK